jgi:hypothetical protein
MIVWFEAATQGGRPHRIALTWLPPQGCPGGLSSNGNTNAGRTVAPGAGYRGQSFSRVDCQVTICQLPPRLA